jgi:hypothetical protein
LVAPWKLPLLVVAIAVPIVAGFLLGGPGIGVSVGALVALAVVYLAVRARPRGAIGAPEDAAGRMLLVVIAAAVEEPGAIEAIAAAAREADRTMILAPARIGFLDRWASDLEAARRAAQEDLVLTVASLAAAGVEAEARVGDEDLVQAVEDQVGSFPASEVILISADAADDPGAEQAATELGARLRVEFRRILV